jgi:hypothetical protein
MAVGVKEAPSFEADAARPLSVTRRPEPSYAGDLFSYDVSPDGERIPVNMDIVEATSTALNVVLNRGAESK